MGVRKEEQKKIPVKRNPYLTDYGRERATTQRATTQRATTQRATTQRATTQRVAAKRRRRFQLQCLAVSLGLLTLLALGVGLLLRNGRTAAASGNQDPLAKSGLQPGRENIDIPQPQSTPELTVQGIPAGVFAKHPDWEEKFLTPNEYSRPGDELKEVKNIFVHYTANPGTSAEQNRSYFERQKDEHKASVSSHFIIGYDGEILQCVPLTEIAYAVRTRNFDSVSIECCYKAKDGSFTQETYNSLISLLAWLTEAYGLETDDILRHYDCGGKKCPLYYTNHPDKWEQLKNDVDKL